MLAPLLFTAAAALAEAAAPTAIAARAPATAPAAAAPLDAATILSPAAADFVAEATRGLIAGEELPRDFPVRLQALDPGQRLLVIVHLRRAGYLTNVVMPVDWVISPATRPDDEAGR